MIIYTIFVRTTLTNVVNTTMDAKERKRVIDAARVKYAHLVKINPALSKLQQVFDLRIDVEREAENQREADAEKK